MGARVRNGSTPRSGGTLKLVALVLVAAPLVTAAQAQERPPFVVIVNPANPTLAVEEPFLARAFLKKTTRWPGGQPIQPVNLPIDSALRRRFDELIIGRPTAAVRSYWQQAIYSGRDVPPPELDSQEDVIDYVSRHPGAIGYVSPAADLEGVRVLGVR